MGESIDENQNVHMSRQPSRVYLLQTAAKVVSGFHCKPASHNIFI